MKKFKVWCDICGYIAYFKDEKNALVIASMHKKGFHKAGENKK